MLGFGPPVERQAGREWWRRQIQRQQEFQMIVAEFCRRHGIQPVTFYSWRRRFQHKAAASAASFPMPQPQARPLTLRVGTLFDAFWVKISDGGCPVGRLGKYRWPLL